MKQINSINDSAPFGIPKFPPKISDLEDYLKTMQKDILENQTWPIWLLPNDFLSWYKYEQMCRHDKGITQLPDPPADIIHKVFGL